MNYYRVAEAMYAIQRDKKIKMLEPSDKRLGQNSKTAYFVRSFTTPDVPESEDREILVEDPG